MVMYSSSGLCAQSTVGVRTSSAAEHDDAILFHLFFFFRSSLRVVFLSDFEEDELTLKIEPYPMDLGLDRF